MTATDEDTTTGERRVPGLAVWAVSILGALVGLALSLGGLALLGFSDRTRIGELVRSGEIQTEGLTEAEAVDLVAAMTWWGGLGLLLTGLLLVLAGVGFVVYQRRVSRRQGVVGVEGATVWSYALLGAFVTLLTTFLPVSPVLGGGVAGYLRDCDGTTGAKVGGLAGVLAAIPSVVMIAFVGAAFVTGFPGAAAIGGRVVMAAMLAVGALFAAAVIVALSGVGGLLGAILAGGSGND